MIVVDTHVLVFDALAPSRLSVRARRTLAQGSANREIACCDISLWEIAMLIARGRLDPGMAARQFLDDLIAAHRVSVLPVNPDIAVLAQSDAFAHGDPADRLIGATAMFNRARLITSDAMLRKVKGLATVW